MPPASLPDIPDEDLFGPPDFDDFPSDDLQAEVAAEWGFSVGLDTAFG
jgi:hypothetical protein